MSGACSAEPETPSAKKERPAALVSVAPVEDGKISQNWSFLGEVRARARAEVAAGASGAVTRVTVREGDRIKKGQLLLEVDPALAAARTAVAAAELEQVQERLAQAKRDLDRVSALSERAISDADVERARSTVSALESERAARHAQNREANAQYVRHLVRAPFDGVVARRVVDQGDWVNPGVPVLELVSSGEVDVLVSVDQTLLRSVSVGDAVTLNGGSSTGAVVAAVVPALDPVARTARIRLTPSEPQPWLIPGSTVDVTFAVDAEQGGVVVPRDAVIEAQTGARLVKVVDSKAQSVAVRVIARSSNALLVLGDGLSAGDRVVVRGNERLRPGQSVRVADES
ncbi:MAG: efflux RND transporter periplasmic adaptor subunit, partial [Myxococcota bacterium]